MFILRPSSPIERQIQPLETQPPKPVQTGAFIDEGLPIPFGYQVDIVRAVIQDPFRIFVYWEVQDKTLGALTRYFPSQDVAEFRTVLRLLEIEGRNEAFFEVPSSGRYWMGVYPDREYEFEIGLRSPRHGYITIVRSNRVRTPRGTISPEPPTPDGGGEFRPDFMKVLEASGFSAEKLLDLALAAVPGTSVEADVLTAAFLGLPESVRKALMVASEGLALTLDLIQSLPEPLRGDLLRIYFSSGGLIASLSLMHYFPELLREFIVADQEWISDQIHPFHLTPRYFAGGTEKLMWPGGQLRIPGPPRLPGSAGARLYN